MQAVLLRSMCCNWPPMQCDELDYSDLFITGRCGKCKENTEFVEEDTDEN